MFEVSRVQSRDVTFVRRATGAAVVALCLASAVAGCGGGSESSQSQPPVTLDTSKLSPTDLPEMPELDDATGAIADASFEKCSTKPGKATVRGAVTNRGKDRSSYGVTVSWVTATSDVLTRGVVVVEDLAPGASESFAVSATVPDGVKQCTFHVVRGTGG